MTITEGGSNSEVWNQIKADMLGCKSATLENAQGAVLTDAVIAAYAVGDLEDPSQVFEKTRKIKKIYEPDPIRTKYYRSIYEQQRKLIKDDMAAVLRLYTRSVRFKNKAMIKKRKRHSLQEAFFSCTIKDKVYKNKL